MKYFYLICFFILYCQISYSFALTDPQYKTDVDLYYEAPSLVWQPPTWFQPVSLAKASEDINHWMSILPYQKDKNLQRYLVIPQLGLITPVVRLDPTWKDYQTMLQGGQIDINQYLTRGVLEYAGAAKPGYIGHTTIFGHSNQYKNAAGDYKTIFASLFWLDPNDQVWIFDKQADGSYKLFKYLVEESYLTTPKDVKILQYDGNGSDLTVFGCAHGLDYRWVVQTSYIGEPIDPRNVYGLPSALHKRLDADVQKIFWLPDSIREQKVKHLMGLVNIARKVVRKTDTQRKLIEYLDFYLPQLLPY